MNKEEILKKISFIFVYLLIIIISGEIIFSLFIFVNNLNKSYKSLEIRYLETLENQKALSEYIKRSQKLGPFYSQPYLDFPVYKSESAPLILNAKAVISLLVKEDGKEKILYLKNRREKLPIASLTKLMTAHIALKLYHPDEIIVIKKEGREGQEAVGNYKVGEKFKLKDLLHSVLMESSNEAAIAIAQKKGVEEGDFEKN
jgi:D-alanyl-D-alanine carboxypeptidase